MGVTLPFHLALAAAMAGVPPAEASGGLAQNIPSASAVMAAPPLPKAAQPLDVAIPWTWPQLGPNQISLQQFTFSDTQPQSCEPGAPFVTGTSSFSNAYQTFLQLIDPARFAPSALLEQAVTAATRPAFPPSTVGAQAPPGWLAVPDSGGNLGYRPEYSVAMTPMQWQGSFGLPTVRVRSPSGSFLSNSPQAAELNATASDPEVTAETVVRVPISAGPWYSDAMVTLAADGPFLNGLPPDKVVGDNGILRCRVTEIFVASGLTVSVSIQAEAAPTMAQHLENADAQVGPLSIKDAAAARVTSSTAEGTRYTLATSPEMPFIIGVSVVRVIR